MKKWNKIDSRQYKWKAWQNKDNINKKKDAMNKERSKGKTYKQGDRKWVSSGSFSCSVKMCSFVMKARDGVSLKALWT